MNIEGSERLAIQGMTATFRQIQVLCISCHDFLAAKSRDDSRDEAYRTKNVVRKFLLENGLSVTERTDPGLPPYIRDQLWASNPELVRKRA